MKGLLNINGKFGQLINKFGQIILLSVYWIIFSIPVFTAGSASAALFYTSRKMLRNEEGKLFDTFTRAFKENFKQGTAAGIILLVVCFAAVYCGLMMLGMGVFSDTLGTVAGLVYLAVIIAVVVYFHYVFAYMATFEDPFKTVARNCVYMALMHFSTSVRVAIQLIIVIACVYFLNLIPYLPAVILLAPGVYCVLLVDPLDKVLRQYMPKDEESSGEADAENN